MVPTTTYIVFLLPITLTIYPIPRLVEYCNMLKEDYGFADPVTWEDATVHELSQDWADMLGWDELTEIVARTYHQLTPEEQARTMIFAGIMVKPGHSVIWAENMICHKQLVTMRVFFIGHPRR